MSTWVCALLPLLPCCLPAAHRTALRIAAVSDTRFSSFYTTDPHFTISPHFGPHSRNSRETQALAGALELLAEGGGVDVANGGRGSLEASGGG